MAFDPFQTVGTAIETGAVAYAIKLSTTFSLQCVMFAQAAVTLWVLVLGFNTVLGKTQDPVAQGLWHGVKMSIIFAFALVPGFFQSEIMATINGLATDLMRLVITAQNGTCAGLSGDPMGVYSALDCQAANVTTMVEGIFYTPLERFKNLKFYDLGPSLLMETMTYLACGVLAVIAEVVIFLIVVVEFVTARLGLQLIMSVGPVFIAFLAFEPTRKYFDGWVSKVVYFLTVQVLLVIFIGMSMSILQGYLKEMMPTEPTQVTTVATWVLLMADTRGRLEGTIIGFVLVSVVLGFMALKIPGIAGGLVGHQSAAGGLASAAASFAAGRLGKAGSKDSKDSKGSGGSLKKG